MIGYCKAIGLCNGWLQLGMQLKPMLVLNSRLT
jgi:hypothetical protein